MTINEKQASGANGVAYVHFTGPQKLTIAVLRKTIREASLVCAALERMGHEAHPFGWSDPEKNASMGYCKFDLVDSGGSAPGDRDAHDLVWEDLLHPRHRSRSTFVERNPLDPGTTPDPTPDDEPLTPATAARLLHDDFALTLEEQTCILDALGCIDRQVNGRGHERAQRDSVETILAHIGELQHDAIRWQELQRAKAEPEASDPAVVLGAVGEAGRVTVALGGGTPEELADASVVELARARKALDEARQRPAKIEVLVCRATQQLAHLAAYNLTEAFPTVRFRPWWPGVGVTGVTIDGIDALGVDVPNDVLSRCTLASGSGAEAIAVLARHEGWHERLQEPKPVNPVKRDADLGDPVRITKFGQLWSLRVPSEADSYGVVVSREVGGDGVLRWKVCPIAEENDIASWCEGVERISVSEWLNLLGARDVRERAQREASEPENEPKGEGEDIDVRSSLGRAVQLRGGQGSRGVHTIASLPQHTDVHGVWCDAVIVASETSNGIVTSVVPVAALEVV